MRRAIVPLLIGIVCFLFALIFRALSYLGRGDLRQALIPALDLISGTPALSHPVTPFYIPSPLTITPLGLPFAPLPEQFANALFIGLSCTWLAWHFQKPAWRLLSFLSLPMLFNIMLAQYLPLIIAMSLSRLAPLALLIKPQSAIPLVLTFRARRWAWIAALLIGMLSLLVFGLWPIKWLQQIALYQGFIPLLTFPGILIPLVLLFRRDRAAWLLVLMAAMPQRAAYDLLPLALLPNSRREMIALTLIGWLSFLSIFSQQSEHVNMVWFFYMPALVILIAPRILVQLHITHPIRSTVTVESSIERGSGAARCPRRDVRP